MQQEPLMFPQDDPLGPTDSQEDASSLEDPQKQELDSNETKCKPRESGEPCEHQSILPNDSKRPEANPVFDSGNKILKQSASGGTVHIRTNDIEVSVKKVTGGELVLMMFHLTLLTSASEQLINPILESPQNVLHIRAETTINNRSLPTSKLLQAHPLPMDRAEPLQSERHAFSNIRGQYTRVGVFKGDNHQQTVFHGNSAGSPEQAYEERGEDCEYTITIF